MASPLATIVKGLAETFRPRSDESFILGSVKGGLASAFSMLSHTLFKGEMQGGLTEEEMVNLYGNYMWVNKCVGVVAKAIARLPLVVYERVPKSDKVPSGSRPLENGYPYELLQNPNPRMSMYDIMEYVASSLLLVGDSYTENVRVDDDNPLSPITALYPWQPHRFRIAKGRRGGVAGYLYRRSASEIIPFPEHKISHVKLYNPIDDYYGMSPISSIRDSITTDRYAIKLNKYFLKNDARPLGVLEVKRRLTRQARMEIRQEWESIYGAQNEESGSGRIAILGHDASFKDIGLAPADAQFLESRKLSKEEIALIFGVPLMKVGEDVSGVRTAEAQEREFYHETVVPLTIKVLTALNKVLLFDIGITDRYIDVDYSVVSVLQEDQLGRAERHRIYVQTGIMTVNEARREIGLEAVEWGNTFFQPLNVAPVGEGGGQKPKKPRITPTGDQVEQSFPDDGNGNGLTQKLELMRREFHTDMRRYVEKALRKQGNNVTQ